MKSMVARLGTLAYMLAVAVVAATPEGCAPHKLGETGFKARFFRFNIPPGKRFGRKFFSSGYRTTLTKEVSGVTDVDVDLADRAPVYGYRTTTDRYTLELSGFFKAPVSGTFAFEVSTGKGGAFQLGAGNNCCNDAARSLAELLDQAPLKEYDRSTGDTVVMKTFHELTAGVYYPVRIIMIAYYGNEKLSLRVTDPEGKVVPNPASHVTQLSFKDGYCYSTVTKAWENPHTTTTTQIRSGGRKVVWVRVPKVTERKTITWNKPGTVTTTRKGPLTDVVEVHVPRPVETIQRAWLRKYEFTLTEEGPETDTVYVYVPKVFITETRTGDDSVTITTTSKGAFTDVIIVEVPTATQTVTSVWTGDYTRKSLITGAPGENNTIVVEIPKVYNTITRTWTGDHNHVFTEEEYFSDLVVVEVPTPTVYLTSVWTGKVTNYITIYGGQGDNNTVIVEVPKVYNTVTRTWTGANVVTITEEDYFSGLVVVEVPTPTETFTSVWTGEYTKRRLIIGEPGHNNTVIVEIPKIHNSITRTWTGSSVVTFTEEGYFSDLVIVEVPTPTQTLTQVWTGDFTNIELITGGPGENNTVIVEIPKVYITNTRTWTGSEMRITTEEGYFTGIVLVEVPTPTHTLTSVWTGSYTNSRLVTGAPGESNTVVVEIPKVRITTTRTWTGAGVVTSTETGQFTDFVFVNVPSAIHVTWSRNRTSSIRMGRPENNTITEIPKGGISAGELELPTGTQSEGLVSGMEDELGRSNDTTSMLEHGTPEPPLSGPISTTPEKLFCPPFGASPSGCKTDISPSHAVDSSSSQHPEPRGWNTTHAFSTVHRPSCSRSLNTAHGNSGRSSENSVSRLSSPTTQTQPASFASNDNVCSASGSCFASNISAKHHTEEVLRITVTAATTIGCKGSNFSSAAKSKFVVFTSKTLLREQISNYHSPSHLVCLGGKCDDIPDKESQELPATTVQNSDVRANRERVTPGDNSASSNRGVSPPEVLRSVIKGGTSKRSLLLVLLSVPAFAVLV